MATVTLFESVRHNEDGKVTYDDTYVVVFDRAVPAGWTHALAEAAVIADGKTLFSAHADAAGCLLRGYDTRQTPERCHVFLVICQYKTWETSSSGRQVNDEWVEVQGGTKTVTEYFDKDNNPLDDSDGKHGVQKLLPSKVYRVHRIHSTSRDGTWEAYACKTNSGAVTTPDSATLGGGAGTLLFLYATARPVDADKYEVVYIFVHDLARINTEGGVQDLKHREAVATVDKETGKVTAVSLKVIYEQAAIGSAMGDE